MSVRDARLDYTKLLLIACVVFGHLLEPAMALPGVAPLYQAIYLFHIPAFVFLCGLFTRPDHVWPRVLHLALLLIIFQGLYLIYLPVIGLEASGNILRPYWILWFLLSLICWSALAPLMIKCPWPLTIALMLALIAGLIDQIGYSLSLSRSFYFFPFFVLGLCHGEKIIRFITARPWWWGALGVLACLAALLWLSPLDSRLFYGSFSFEKLGQEPLEGILMRAGLLALSGLALLSVIRLMPGSPSSVARLGAGTLAVFILHGFVVLPLQPLMSDIFTHHLILGYGVAAALTLGMVIALAQPFLTRLLNLPLRIFKKSR